MIKNHRLRYKKLLIAASVLLIIAALLTGVFSGMYPIITGQTTQRSIF